ncbi:hypothetical protein HED50_12645 [Ochrobactrum oryzae]|nr:hypothetical protein [Brucella oryzae]
MSPLKWSCERWCWRWRGYGGGGGMGAGGAIFVGKGANVTVENVSLDQNKATGGKGGSGE